MASASSLAHFNNAGAGDKGLETIEIDPQFAQGLGLVAGDVVCYFSTDVANVAESRVQGRDWFAA